MVTSATFISDTVKWLRDSLSGSITDPISTARVGNERFVMSSYPRRKCKYPILTVRCMGAPINRNLGIGSEIHSAEMQMQVRVWARNEVERDALTQQVENFLRTNQYPASTTNTSANQDLWNMDITSTTPVDETGQEGIKRQVIMIMYDFFVGT